MNYKFLIAGLIAALLAVAACGDSGEEGRDDRRSGAIDDEVTIDLDDLPDDFPRELMPPKYDRADYVDLRSINGTRAATFENTSHVQEAIGYYTGLIGEPTIDVDSGDGDRLAQWHGSPFPPWVVGVMGGADETIVTVSTVPEQ